MRISILTTAALALASTAFAQPGNQAPLQVAKPNYVSIDRKSTRLNSSHSQQSRMPSSA